MIRITHEFPLCYYLDGTAEKLTDYTYCLVHRYLENEDYRNYMKDQVKKGRIVYLDNSLYELGAAWDQEAYADVIRELKPTYYMLPDVFLGGEENKLSQFGFLSSHRDLPSTPIAIPHSTSLIHLGMQLEEFCRELPPEVMIAIPFGDHSFENNNDETGYFNANDIPYTPLRQAQNRKMFLKTYADVLKNRQIHLLGCKSLAEFDDWNSNFDKSNIVSIDTSHPVAMTLEGPCNNYEWGFFNPFRNGIKAPMHWYKPEFLIDKHFEDKFDINLTDNVLYFQGYVRRWIGR